MSVGPVLAFDTSAAHCAAVLLVDGVVVVDRMEPMAKGQAERLIPLLEEVLAAGGIGWADLAGVGVGTGPGNFTGVRIAVAAARGIALARGIPAIGVTGFAAAGVADGPVVLPGRTETVYVQTFASGAPDGPAVEMAACDVRAPHLVARLGAAGIARVAAARLASGRPEPRPAPLYLRAADAAPPSEPPPRVLS